MFLFKASAFLFIAFIIFKPCIFLNKPFMFLYEAFLYEAFAMFIKLLINYLRLNLSKSIQNALFRKNNGNKTFVFLTRTQ